MVFSQLVLIRILRLSLWIVIASGCLIAVLGLILAVSAASPRLFLIGMVFIGLAQGMILPTNLALLSLRSGKNEQGAAAGINAISQGLGMVVGPIAGAALFTATPTAPFAVLLLLYLSLVFGAAFAARATRGQAKSAIGGASADTYDERIPRLIPNYTELHEAALKSLSDKVPQGGSVLVSGAGTGSEIIGLGRLRPDLKLTAIDPSGDMLAIAKKKMKQIGSELAVDWHVCTLADFTPDKTCDAALCLLVCHFIPDDGPRGEFFRHAAATLKPNGSFIAADLADLGVDVDHEEYRAWVRSTGASEEAVNAMFDRIATNFHPIDIKRQDELLSEAGMSSSTTFFEAINYRGYWATKFERARD